MTPPDGVHALEFGSRMPISMLVKNLQMPNMDGFTLALNLAARKPAFPVLLISGAAKEIPSRNWSVGIGSVAEPVDRVRLLWHMAGSTWAAHRGRLSKVRSFGIRIISRLAFQLPIQAGQSKNPGAA